MLSADGSCTSRLSADRVLARCQALGWALSCVCSFMFTWHGEAANVTRPVRFTGEGTGRERLSALPEALSLWRAVSTGRLLY